MENRDKQISDIIVKWMSERAVTQTQFADQLGISQSFLSRLLRGVNTISPDRMKKIVDILKPPKDEITKVNTLLYAKNDEDPNGLKQIALDLCHKTIDQIGPDAMLLQVLINWCGFGSEQKIDAVTKIMKIAESHKGESDK